MTLILFFVSVLIITHPSNNCVLAQFQISVPFVTRCSQIITPALENAWNRSMGIGNFTNNTDVLREHFPINTNYLSILFNETIISLCEVFCAIIFSNLTNAWCKFTGNQAVGVSEAERGTIFSRSGLFTPFAFNNWNFSLQENFRDITFHVLSLINVTGIGTKRIRIVEKQKKLSGTNYIVQLENVGIGILHPLSILHIGLNAVVNNEYRD